MSTPFRKSHLVFCGEDRQVGQRKKHTHSYQPATLSESHYEAELTHLEFRVGLLSLQTVVTNRVSGCLFCVLVSENGKVAVEYDSTQEELTDSLTEEDLKGLVQVKAVDI